jgi:hypothetical protein
MDSKLDWREMVLGTRGDSVRPAHEDSVLEVEVSNPLPCSIFTCNWASYKPEMGVAVRTTVGKAPKWFPYPMLESKSLKPWKTFRSELSLEDARLVYMAELDKHEGWVMGELEQFAKIAEGQPLILLCFEKLITGIECHRRWAADWFATKGIDVPELPLQLPPVPKPVQDSLF